MPFLTRLFVKTAFIYFVVALLVGIALVARSLASLTPMISALGPTYLHLFLVGWVTQLIFGIVYWMFPKYSREHPHGSERAWKATYGLLNAGLVLRAVAEPLHAAGAGEGWGGWLGLSAVLQWLAGVLFVLNTWGRVKER
ncbi:MAG: hypothetical protein D6796_11270 [Caldilineae bacterium]|nr:MAG: hypothetical protein D6796_11270 [Caldilineae bacterium]